MIGALLTQKVGASQTTLVLRLACRWAGQGTLSRVYQWGSILHWSELPGHRCFERFAYVIDVAHRTLHREVPKLARRCGHVVVDLCAVRLAAGFTSAVLRRLDVGAFHRSPSVADTLRDVIVREVSHTNGGFP